MMNALGGGKITAGRTSLRIREKSRAQKKKTRVVRGQKKYMPMHILSRFLQGEEPKFLQEGLRGDLLQ